MDISPKCAVELLEVIKHLDNELKAKIPVGFEDYLDNMKDPNYFFELDKSKVLFEQDFMDETVEILMALFANEAM